jgi:hypothetical protein
MIHTFEIGTSISRTKLTSLIRDQVIFAQVDLQNILNGKVSNIESKEYIGLGFNKFRLSRKGSDKYFYLKVVVNPQVMLEQRATVELFNCTVASIEKFNEIFDQELGILTSTVFESANNWAVQRIDYALDINTEYPSQYVSLAKRVKYPKAYIEYINEPGSFYVKCDSVTLNFYDKYDEFAKKRKNIPDFNRLLNEASNIFRVEVQCTSSKLFSIMNKFNLPDINLGGFLNSDIAQHVVQYHYGTTLGYCDYYSLESVEQYIASTTWRKDKKTEIYKLLRLIAQERSLLIAQETYYKGTTLKETGEWVQGSRRTFYDYMASCKKMNINPIIIPTEWGINFLKNPMFL